MTNAFLLRPLVPTALAAPSTPAAPTALNDMLNDMIGVQYVSGAGGSTDSIDVDFGTATVIDTVALLETNGRAVNLTLRGAATQGDLASASNLFSGLFAAGSVPPVSGRTHALAVLPQSFISGNLVPQPLTLGAATYANGAYAQPIAGQAMAGLVGAANSVAIMNPYQPVTAGETILFECLAHNDVSHADSIRGGFNWRNAAGTVTSVDLSSMVLAGSAGVGIANTVRLAQSYTMPAGAVDAQFYMIRPAFSGSGTALVRRPFMGRVAPVPAHRWWRIGFTGVSAPMEIGRLVMGERFQPEVNFSFGAQIGATDLAGGDFNRRGIWLPGEGVIQRTAGLRWPWATRVEAETNISQLLERVGNRGHVLACIDPDPHPERQRRLYFGPLRGNLGQVWNVGQRFEWRADLASVI